MVTMATVRQLPSADLRVRREMAVFAHGGVGFRGGRMVSAQQVFPVDYEVEVSQRLVEAAKRGDLSAAIECLADPCVDVNFVGAVSLKIRKAVVVLHEESADEVRIEYEELRTYVSALFLAAHSADIQLARKLLSAGADVNQKLFLGFAMTAAAKEAHADMAELLLKSGASQQACEEALLEACCHGHATVVDLLMASDLIRPRVAVRGLIMSSARGFVNVVESLLKHGVDANATGRLLLQSAKPPLHTNADCSALIAAVVSRQVSIVKKLLEAGAETDVETRLGGWSWDRATGEEIRVGAGLAEPYGPAWCAIEYFESSGTILGLLLREHPLNAISNGRALLHHAILCSNVPAVDLLLKAGADPDLLARSAPAPRPIHLAARLGRSEILRRLLAAGCHVDSRMGSGHTALTVAAVHGQRECLCILALAGADFGLVSHCRLSKERRDLLEGVMLELTLENSGAAGRFCALHCAARRGDQNAVVQLLQSRCFGVDVADADGYTPLMLAAKEGHVGVCRLLIASGARCGVSTGRGETVLSLARGEAEGVILDELARALVVGGAALKKHTKEGRGKPHVRTARMVDGEGVLTWGEGRRRNVVCCEAEVGPSSGFVKNRKGKADVAEPGLFRVRTVDGREVHFSCLAGGAEAARLWVRGVRLLFQSTCKQVFFSKSKVCIPNPS
ncbi:ankyrin [Wolffia australiana]